MNRLAALVLLVLGCYQDPAALDVSSVISVAVQDAEGVAADGTTVVTVVVTIDPETSRSEPITVTASSGIVDFGSSGDEARSVDVRHGGVGVLDVPLQVGTVAGPVLVSASVAGVRAETAFLLQRSFPTSLVARLDSSVLVANGSDTAALSVSLLTDDGTKVSDGTVLSLAACCGDDITSLATCDSPPPLQIPDAWLVERFAATIPIGTQLWTEGDPLKLWLAVSAAADGNESNPCSQPEGFESWDAVPLVIEAAGS